MARFRNNTRQLLSEPIYRRPGLKIERVRRYDESVLLPDREVWQNWSFHITLNGTRYVRYGDRSYTLVTQHDFLDQPSRATSANLCSRRNTLRHRHLDLFRPALASA